MKPIEIRIELLRKGYSNVRVAAGLQLSARTVHNVIYRHGNSRRVAQEIARLIGKPMTEVWPGQYGAHRLVRKGSAKAGGRKS